MGSLRPAIGFGRRLQRHGHVVIGCDFARVFSWSWRPIPLNTDRDSNSLPDASPGYAGTGAAGSTCPTSCSGGERQFRKCSAVGSTWPGDHPHSDDGAEYRMLNPGPVQIRAVSGRGLDAKTSDGAGNVSWTWIVGSNTTPGQWPIHVTCGSASGQTFLS